MSAGTLYIAVKGDTKELVSALKSAQSMSVKFGKETQKSIAPAGQALDALKRNVLALGASWVSLQGAKAIIQIADQYSLLDSKLKLVTKGSEEFGKVYQELFSISQTTGSSFASNAANYSNLALALKDTNIQSSESLKIFDLVNKSLVVAGASTAEASSFLLQFRQAMGSGVLQGEEFKAMMESNSYFGGQLAKVLDTDIAGLRQMSKDGKLTTDVLRKAFPEMAATIEKDFGGIQKTISRAMVELQNAFNDVVADANKTTGGTNSVAASVSDLAKSITENKETISAIFVGMIEGAKWAGESILTVTRYIQGLAIVAASQDKDMWDWLTAKPGDMKTWLSEAASGVAQLKDQLKGISDEIAQVSKVRIFEQDNGGWTEEAEKRYQSLISQQKSLSSEIENAGKIEVKTSQETAKAVESSGKVKLGISEKQIKAAEKFKEKQEALENTLLVKMEQRAIKEVEYTKWADGSIRETIQSQYDFKLAQLDKEIAGYEKTAKGSKANQDLIVQYHKEALQQIQSYDDLYSSENQKRLEGMQDPWMRREELRIEKLSEDYTRQMDLEEELNTYLETTGNDRLASQLARLKKKELADMRVAEGDIELQKKVAEMYRLKNEEILRDAWKTEREQLLISGKLVDGMHAALLEIQHDYTTMGDIAYGTFMDIRDTWRDEVGGYLIKEFGGIEGAWGGLWDRALQRFGDYLADMVLRFAAAIAEMAAIWAATEFVQWWTGNESFSFSAGGNRGSSGGGATAGGVATSVVGAVAKEYIMSEYVTPALSEYVYPAIAEAAAAITGATSASVAAATATGTGTAGTLTPALMEALASSSGTAAATTAGTAATTEGIAVAGSTIGTSSVAAEAGGTAAGTIGTTAASYAGPAAIVAMIVASAIAGLSDSGGLKDHLNNARISPTGLSQLGGITMDGELNEMTEEAAKALSSLKGQMGAIEAVSIDAASGIVVMADAIQNPESGLTDSISYSIAVFDQATGTWKNSQVSFQDLLNQMSDIGPVSDEAIAATAQYVAEMAGMPSIGDELALAFTQMGTGIFELADGTVAATGTVANAVKMMNEAIGSINSISFEGFTWDEGGDVQAYIDSNNESGHYYDNEPMGHADGGYHSGGWRIVGERGPELEYTPPSHIFSNEESRRMFSAEAKSTSEQPTVIHNHFYVDGKEIASSIMPAVDRHVASKAARGQLGQRTAY